jgi:uncharacterized repeat protein (TIGR01451 family)
VRVGRPNTGREPEGFGFVAALRRMGMRGKFLGAALVALMFVTSAAGAWAKPSVALVLAGFVIGKDANGAEVATPIADTTVAPGKLIRYVITATNKGDQDAQKLIPVGKVPNGTAYEPGSASAKDALRVEYSLDEGKTWSAQPMVTVHTPTGDVVKPADPATYTRVRWVADKALPPKGVVTYSYEVRVK